MMQNGGVKTKGPFDTPEQRFHAGRLGMWLFLMALAVLFCATIIGFLVMRLQSEAWAELDLPTLPAGLWISTALLIVSSGTMHWALRSARNSRAVAVRAALVMTSALGLGFLLLQGQAWLQWAEGLESALMDVDDEQMRFAATGFYVMTGIHAAHVLGGMLPLLWITGRAFAGAYHARRWAPVYFMAAYWHFLDIVWVVLFVTLLLGI